MPKHDEIRYLWYKARPIHGRAPVTVLARLLRRALGIMLMAAVIGCHAVVSPQPGWDPYASGIGPMPHGSRVLGDQ